jgi:hypothetical protein
LARIRHAVHSLFTESGRFAPKVTAMEQTALRSRLGLNVPYEWWPSAPSLKETEAAGFARVQVPSPPESVLSHPRDSARHAAALASALGTAGLRPVLHGPGSLRVGTAEGDRALEGLLSYAPASAA